MPVEYFIRYQGLCYDVGTRLRFKNYSYGYYCGIEEGVIEKFVEATVFIRGYNGKLYNISTTRGEAYFDKIITEIIEPVYYIPEYTTKNNCKCPSPWDVEMGWIWYIIVMIFGAIFKERLMVWMLATAYFFLWKNGFLNGGKE